MKYHPLKHWAVSKDGRKKITGKIMIGTGKN